MANSLPDMNPRRTLLARKLFQNRNGKTLGMSGHPGFSRPSNPASDAFGNLQKYLQQTYLMQQQQQMQDPFADTTDQTQSTTAPTTQNQAVTNPYSTLGLPSNNTPTLTQPQDALPGQPGSALYNQYPSLFTINTPNQ